jgi:ABC-type glycerol-3-phosphate transport system substrate-binding protein
MKNVKYLRRQALRFAASLTLVAMLGAGCTQGPDAATIAASKRITLKVWAVVDDQDVYAPLLTDFRQLHPYVEIEYRRFRLEEYEDEILNALAEDQGPDVFMLHNTWIGKYQSKLAPMPASTKVAVQTVQGTLKKELVYSLQNEPSVTLRQFKNDYPEIVAKDMVRTVDVSTTPDKKDLQPRIMALPLSVDTLGLYVNKDLLNAAGIATIPANWDDFQAAVQKLTKLDGNSNILQSGAALGTSANVERAPDILSALMLQNGAEMSADDGTPAFTSIPDKLKELRDTPPAYQALAFYTDFANPNREVYTWNAQQPDSLEAFVAGKVAFFFGYGYQLPTIKARAPKLNLGIATLPQIKDSPVANFANYWAWSVAKKSQNQDVAWNFVNFMAKPAEAKKYLDLAKRPAAQNSLLPAQLEDEDVGVFASQVLTAQSWYRGNDPRAADKAFNDLIDAAQGKTVEEYPALVNTAAEIIAQTITYVF